MVGRTARQGAKTLLFIEQLSQNTFHGATVAGMPSKSILKRFLNHREPSGGASEFI